MTFFPKTIVAEKQDNDFSINNFLKEGYVYAKTEEKYGGLVRNLYYKVL